MSKNGIIKAGIMGVIAVLAGAFGAHALKEILTVDQLTSFNTGARYQLVHAVVLLVLFLLMDKFQLKQFKIASVLIFWGIILFSGSIYLLALKDFMGMDWLKFLGPLTPLGGTLIITGWFFVILGGIKIKI